MMKEKFVNQFLCSILFVYLFISIADAKYSGGSGTPEDPYLISLCGDLITLSSTPEDLSKCYLMTNDINFYDTSFDNSIFYAPFTGVFDGNNYTIIFSIQGYPYPLGGRPSSLGLFGKIDGGLIKNLKIDCRLLWHYERENQWDQGICGVGVLAGLNSGEIVNCDVNATITSYGVGSRIGGLVGSNSGIIRNCSANVIFEYEYSLGGPSVVDVGGIAGLNSGTISNCFTTGIVEGYSSVAGIAGSNLGNVNNCWTNCSVIAYYNSNPTSSAGLVCYNQNSGVIENCYSLAFVNSKKGLVRTNEGSVTASFWDVNYTNCTTSAGGTGLTTAQMQDRNTFINAGWDVVESANGTAADIWKMDPNIVCYPKLVSQSYNYYSGGAGSCSNPFKISTKQDLVCLDTDKENYSKNYILINDINLADTIFTGEVIGPNDFPFKGTFDGGGHKIKNLNIKTFLVSGFFGCLGTNSIVRNLGIEECNFSPCDPVGTEGKIGALAGKNNYGNITNCFSTGKIQGYSTIGGLVGLNNYGNISNSFSKVNVKANQIAGGLVGSNIGSNNVSSISGNITNCFCEGTIEGNNRIGGLVGESTYGKINSSFTKVDVICRNTTGGLIGNAYYALIKNCYSSSSIIGTDFSYAGGLAGRHNHHLGITKSYSVSNINRLIGNLNTTNLSFWDSEIADGDPVGTGGLTTAEMQTLSTFTNAGWDFSYADGNEAVWFMPENDYPILTWQISPVDISTDGKNNFKDFAALSRYWMRDDCRNYNYFCDFADLDYDGSVDLDDLIELMNYWLDEGVYE
ncbi:MAG: GLUG motif-containing protein [Phycisphaerales bacterium]